MRKAKPWIAVVLSVISPGLGHLYCGRILAAFIAAAVLGVVAMPATLTIQFAPVATLIGAVLFIPIYVVGVAFYAARAARVPTHRFVTKPRLIGAAVLFLIVTGFAGEGLRVFRDRYAGEPFRSPSGAMLPTLSVGDHFYTSSTAYNQSDPQRGDIVVFNIARDQTGVYAADRRPYLPQERFVKRIVGIPGDTVVLEGATLIVNGVEATREPTGDTYEDHDGHALMVRSEALGEHEYLVLDDPTQKRSRMEFTVEPNRYFVSGDHRLYSNDSRYWGTIRRDAIVGKVTKIYWSWNFNGPSTRLFNPVEWFRLLRTETRWERIGRQPS